MSENAKTFYTRIKQKRGTAEYWEEQNQFIPLEGEIIVYTANETEPQKIKIGDGEKTVAQLPFITSNIIEIDDKGGSAITGASFDLENGKIILNKDLPNAGDNTLGVVKSGGVATINNGEITAISNAEKVKHVLTIQGNGTTAGSFDGSAEKTVNIKGAGSTTVAGNANGTITVTGPNALKNPNALKIGAKSYDGSSAIEITASDLGLSAAMKFLGTSATAITDGAATNPITIGGNSVTVESGNVVLYGSKEFVWNGTAWEELGNEGSYKITQTAVSSPSASGTATAFIDTISQDTNGKITVTKKNVAVATTSTSGLMSAADKIALDKAVEALDENDCYGARKLEGDLVTTESMEGLAIHPVSYIEPNQAGTGDPSPTNVRAISGWNTITATRAGTNLAKTIVPLGITSNTQITCNSQWRSIEVPVTSNTYYTIKRASVTTGTRFRYCFTETEASLVEGEVTYCFDMHEHDAEIVITVQAPTNAKYMYVYLDNTNSDINLSEYTIYEPHEAQTITTNLPETVYGGSLDWTNGLLTVNRFAKVLDGTETFVLQTVSLAGATGFYMNTEANGMPLAKTTQVMSSHFVSETAGQHGTVMNATSMNNTRINVLFNVDSTVCGSTISEFKNYLSAQKTAGTPVIISYEMAEPYTIQLTPQQLKAIDGTNSVWSNCGPTEAIFNLTPEIIYNDNYQIVKKSAASFVSARSVEGLAIHPISHMEPIQAGEGTPSPDNVRAISGFDGLKAIRTKKNFLSCKDKPALPYTSNGITFSDGGDGKIAISGTATAGASLTLIKRGAGSRDIIKAGTYTVSGSSYQTNATVYYQFYENQTDAMGESFLTVQTSSGSPQKTFTLEKDCYYGCYISVSSGKTPEGYTIPQLERGQTATEYEPYDGDTLSVEFPETIGGGSYDWATGELITEWAYFEFDGTEPWAMSTSAPWVGEKGNGFYMNIVTNYGAALGMVDVPPVCSAYKGYTRDGINTSVENTVCMGNGGKELLFAKTQFDTVDEWKAHLAALKTAGTPLQVAYKLITPDTIQLPPQQLKTTNGTNIVHSSAQKTEAIFNLPMNIPVMDIPFVDGTQTAATSALVGNAPSISKLIDGQTIRYWLPQNMTSTSATLELTLKDGSTTGAKNVYWKGSTRLNNSYYAAGTVITLTYRENVTVGTAATKYTGWWADADYDVNNYDRLRYKQNIKAGTTAIAANNVIVGKDGLYQALNSGKAFDISYPILFTTAAISASSTSTTGYLVMYLTVTTTQSITLTAYKPVYIKGTLNGTIFTPVSTTPLTQTVPATEDGYDYMLLGTAYSSTAMYLLPEHPIFRYRNGNFGKDVSLDGIWDLSTRGTAIPQNADLDTYTTPGVYYSQESAYSQTMVNPPTKGAGFTLVVKRGYNNAYYYQLAFSNDSFWYRNRHNTTWTEWYDVLKGAKLTGATTTKAGLMSAADKTTLDNLSDLVGDTAVSTQISNAVAGKASQKSAQVTLNASGWTASDDVFTQTVTVSSFTGTGNLIVSPEPSNMAAYVNSSVYASNYTGSNITFIATTQPTENLLVNVMVII